MEAERRWKWIAMHGYFSGDFMWTGLDYLGESFWPFTGFGSAPLDITARPKDSFYFWQSWWADRAVLHLLPHWNWPGREGQTIPVLAYTSCNTVELFLNGRSLGTKAIEFPAQGTSGGLNSYALPVVRSTTNDLHLSWDVTYAPGVLRAVGKHRDGSACAEAEVRTAGAPAAVRLAADRDTVTTAAGDVAQVAFEIVDSAGTVVPTADNVVRFAVTGGSLLVVETGNLQDHDPYRTDRRHAFEGRGLVILNAAQPGTLRVTASADGLREATVTVAVRAAAPEAAIPAAR